MKCNLIVGCWDHKIIYSLPQYKLTVVGTSPILTLEWSSLVSLSIWQPTSKLWEHIRFKGSTPHTSGSRRHRGSWSMILINDFHIWHQVSARRLSVIQLLAMCELPSKFLLTKAVNRFLLSPKAPGNQTGKVCPVAQSWSQWSALRNSTFIYAAPNPSSKYEMERSL